MKITIIGNNSGGMYIFRGVMLERLAENNEICILTPFDENVNELREYGRVVETKMDRRGTNIWNEIRLFCFYLTYLFKERPDLVITYTIKPNIYAGIVCRILGVSYAVNVTGLGSVFQKRGVLRDLIEILYKLSIKHADKIFVENTYIAKVLRRKKLAIDNICVLRGAGVDLERFSPMDYPMDDDIARFLFIGRVMREKGVDELFAAMNRLVKDGEECTLY